MQDMYVFRTMSLSFAPTKLLLIDPHLPGWLPEINVA